MIMGEILGGIALFLLIGRCFADYRYRKGKELGYQQGLKFNSEEAYMQGAADAENFIARAEVEVLQERRKLWDEEIGA